MKIQDLGFFILLMVLLFVKRNPQWLIVAGLLCLVLAMPLFHFWIFFTAERLVWYASAFIFTAILLMFFRRR
jgi:hypothetical protein